MQYQCVLWIDRARAVLGEILSRVSQRGDASFLAVLKQLGNGAGLMSFPLLGYTLAMDFPVTSEIFRFLDELDELVVNAGGRLYLAKAPASPVTRSSQDIRDWISCGPFGNKSGRIFAFLPTFQNGLVFNERK